MSRSSFVAELQRRNVHRAVLFYAGAAWLLVQIATQVFPFFDIPNWAVRGVVIAVLIGFPFAMLFSWFYEWTPQGIKLESEIDRSQSVTRQTGKAMDRWIIAVMAVAIVVLLLNQFVLHRFMPATTVALAAEPKPSSEKSADASAQKSIAVLPLANSTGDPANEYFADGVSEELISSLSRLSNLKVIGRTSSFQFKGKSDDSKTIGEKLGVAYLLEGSVRKSSDRVRIAVALITAADGANVWSESYDREFKDIFAVQSDISSAVAGQLKVALLGNNAQAVQAPSAAAPSNQNVEAYNALLQGNFHMVRATLEDYQKATALFEQAIRLDPGYALAYARLCIAWTSLSSSFLGGDDSKAALVQARNAADTALRLAPDLAEAHRALGSVLLNADLDLAGAERETRKALALEPANALVRNALGGRLAERGQVTEAEAMVRQALVIDPLYTNAYLLLARVLVAEARYDEAETLLRKAIELQPSAARNHMTMAIIDLLRDDPRSALVEAQAEPPGFWHEFALALVLQALDDRKAADIALQKYIDGFANQGAYQIAQIYAFRKQPDQAFEWLDRAYDNRDSGMWLLMYDPILLAYKNDPRFIAFAHKTGAIPAGKP